MSDEQIAASLGIRPMSEIDEEEEAANTLPTVEETEETSVAEPSSGANLDREENLKDIELARKNIENIIQQGDDSLREMIDLAKQSESPRAFEVTANLMKTLLDANKDFVDMSTKKKYAKEELEGPKEAAQQNVTNNNLIVSTADLLKMIKGETDD